MATFKVLSKRLRLVCSLPFLLALSCLYHVFYVFISVICYLLRNHSNLPLMQQKYIHTRLSVSDFSIRRMTVWIWMRYGNRIMVMYILSTQTLFFVKHLPLTTQRAIQLRIVIYFFKESCLCYQIHFLLPALMVFSCLFFPKIHL